MYKITKQDRAELVGFAEKLAQAFGIPFQYGFECEEICNAYPVAFITAGMGLISLGLSKHVDSGIWTIESANSEDAAEKTSKVLGINYNI